MLSINVTTEDDLHAVLSNYREGFLFRGQTGHYLTDAGLVSIPTSFQRHGCIPPLMFKWTHYAKALIRAVSDENYFDMSIELPQAILQHYGWRSFFVDVTKKPAVACWFASNQYVSRRQIHMSENWEENPVWLRHLEADFEEIRNRPPNPLMQLLPARFYRSSKAAAHGYG